VARSRISDTENAGYARLRTHLSETRDASHASGTPMTTHISCRFTIA
jgi:hypothetical protein